MSAIREAPGVYKEKEGVLLNKDADALRSYKHKKAQSKKINEVMTDVADLKQDMLELKTMFKEFLSK
jgi:hypothetical protein